MPRFVQMTADIWVDPETVYAVEFKDYERTKPGKGRAGKREESLIVMPETLKSKPKCTLVMRDMNTLTFDVPDGMSDTDILTLLAPRHTW